MKHWRVGLAILAAPLLVVGLALAQGWGWTPGTAPPTVPPSSVSVRYGTGLQAVVDALPSTGGILQLDPGRFHADETDTTLALTLNKAVTIIGQSFTGTVIASPILIASSDCHLEHLRVRPTGAPYGIKAFITGGGPSRCTFNNLYVGGDSTGDPAAPVIGVYLDGAILFHFEKVTVAYCKGDGAYLNSSQLPTWSTNANLFLNCTFNGNGWYGFHAAGSGIEGTTIIGGNIENNVLGCVRDSACVQTTIRDVDFENNKAVSQIIGAVGCSIFDVEHCNFSVSNATREFLFQSCNNVTVKANYFAHGFTPGSQIGVFDESSFDCREFQNAYVDSNTYIRNSSTLSQQNLFTNGGYQPPIAMATNLAYWVSQDAVNAAGVVGNWAKNDGTLANQNPTSTDLGTQMRRTRWTRTADNQNMGPTAFIASECQFYRGDKQYGGGFYFSATFRLDAAGSIAGGGASTKMFVGLASNSAGLMTAAVDSSTLVGEFVGLYRDGQDKNIFRFVSSDGGTVAKVAFSALGGAANMQYATGEAYQFEMWCPSKGTIVQAKLTSINRRSACGFVTTGTLPAATTMLGPQCLMGTGTGGACSFSVANVYVSR